jgi:hypothetical protein
VALSGALDGRRHRLGKQVLDIKIWQLGAVFGLSVPARRPHRLGFLARVVVDF